MLSLKKIGRISPAILYLVNHTTKRIGSCYIYDRVRHDLTLGLFKEPGNGKIIRPSLFRSSLSTFADPLPDQAYDLAQLALELETAINERRLEDAWKTYEKYLHFNGYPQKSVLSKLIIGMTESFDIEWLSKAYNLVDLALQQDKLELLDREPLIYLSFILAWSNLPALSLNITRKLIKLKLYTSVAAWSGIVGHMCQTETGSFLAAELIMEIGYLFREKCVDPRKRITRSLMSMKPNSFVLNIALTGCLVFGLPKKAEQLLDLMLQIGLQPGPDLLITMARVYEKNGRRDEVKKLKQHMDEAVGLTDPDICELYDCLFSCDLKLGELGSCMDMVLEMLQKAKEAKKSQDANQFVHLPNRIIENDSLWVNTPPPSFLSFSKDVNFSRPKTEAKDLLGILTNRLRAEAQLVKSEHGILYPTEKMYANLIRAFLDFGRTTDLANFLIKVNKLKSSISVEISAVEVINACIFLGLLDQAHDLLDEIRYPGSKVCLPVYYNLLTAYSKDNRQEESIALLKEAQQAGIPLDLTCYQAMIQSQLAGNNSNTTLPILKDIKNSKISEKPTQVENIEPNGIISTFDEVSLTAKLLDEIRQNPGINYELQEWNNTIHFFCKKQLMHDAQKALSKMECAGHTPNSQTFHSLVTAYVAIGGKFIEVTELWGEMKVLVGSNSLTPDRELLDSFLHCFVRGGFFLRAMEVIEMMDRGGMFIDKYNYRSLWLKYHATMDERKTRKIQTEAQLRRTEAALAFKRWIGVT